MNYSHSCPTIRHAQPGRNGRALGTGGPVYLWPGPRALWDSPTWSTPAIEDSESQLASIYCDAESDGPGPVDRSELAYTLALPCEVDLGCFQPATQQEASLKKAPSLGHVLATDLCSVIQTLPTKPRSIHQTDVYGAVLPPLVFGAGAYVHGPMRGLQNNTLRHELVVLALVSLIRSMAPGHKFSSFTVLQNVTSKVHRDQHNLQGSSNLVLPLTNFEGGELWVQCSGGASSMAGHSGHVLPLLQDGVPTPQFFDPHALHATLPWSGDRVVVAAYTIRDSGMLSVQDCAVLSRMGFLL